jgi:hypothetical protein
MDANILRGEAPLRIGTTDIVIAVEFGRLAKLSRALACDSMDELYRRLLGFEPYTVACAIRILTIHADRDEADRLALAAIQQLSSADQEAWRVAIEAALTAHLEKGRSVRESVPLVEDVEMMVRQAEKAMDEGGGGNAKAKKS